MKHCITNTINLLNKNENNTIKFSVKERQVNIYSFLNQTKQNIEDLFKNHISNNYRKLIIYNIYNNEFKDIPIFENSSFIDIIVREDFYKKMLEYDEICNIYKNGDFQNIYKLINKIIDENKKEIAKEIINSNTIFHITYYDSKNKLLSMSNIVYKINDYKELENKFYEIYKTIVNNNKNSKYRNYKIFRFVLFDD